MQAVVKTPHIDIYIKGEIPPKILSVLKEEYGDHVEIIEGDDEALVDVFETDWYRDVKLRLTPGKYLKIYRENHGMTQAELGRKLGQVPRQHISNMECGFRSISLKTARKLAEIFNVSPEKFI